MFAAGIFESYAPGDGILQPNASPALFCARRAGLCWEKRGAGKRAL